MWRRGIFTTEDTEVTEKTLGCLYEGRASGPCRGTATLRCVVLWAEWQPRSQLRLQTPHSEESLCHVKGLSAPEAMFARAKPAQCPPCSTPVHIRIPHPALRPPNPS